MSKKADIFTLQTLLDELKDASELLVIPQDAVQMITDIQMEQESSFDEALMLAKEDVLTTIDNVTNKLYKIAAELTE